MSIIIEIDGDWTVGIDWYKHTKGIRLGFFAIHFVFMKHTAFMGTICEHYHQSKLKAVNNNERGME